MGSNPSSNCLAVLYAKSLPIRYFAMISAISFWIPGNLLVVRLNCTRRWVYQNNILIMSFIVPTYTAPAISRSKFNPAIITFQPLPTGPIRFSSEIRTSSNEIYPFGTLSNPTSLLIFSK